MSNLREVLTTSKSGLTKSNVDSLPYQGEPRRDMVTSPFYVRRDLSPKLLASNAQEEKREKNTCVWRIKNHHPLRYYGFQPFFLHNSAWQEL